MITNTFMKRWASIFGWAKCPWWVKSVTRLLLLSPLLSIWATLYSLMFAKDGVFFRDGERRAVITANAIATLVVFHVGFLGWRMTDGQIKFVKGQFHLTTEISFRDSFREPPPRALESTWLPGQVFSVHVYPYLSPLTKLIFSLYGDFARSRILANEIESSSKVFCKHVPPYIGVVVPNCFLTEYRAMALKRSFVSPAFGLLFETRYRRSAMKDKKPASAMESFGLNAVSVDNLVTLLEPGELVFDRQQFVHPIGLLAIYGSPEIPAIALEQDLQHFALSKKFLPLLAPQLAHLKEGLAEMKGSLTSTEETVAREKLSTLDQRVRALELDPLALQPVAEPPALGSKAPDSY